MRVVMKFGGSSVASAERIKNVAERVKGSGKGHQVVVVCSAMGDVTDELLALCTSFKDIPRIPFTFTSLIPALLRRRWFAVMTSFTALS